MAYIVSTTRDNCILIVCQMRHYTAGSVQKEELIRYGMYCVDKAIQKIEAEGLQPYIHCIYDRLGMTSANRDMIWIKFVYNLAKMMQDYYPERLGNFYVIGANWLYWAAFKMIKPILAQKTRDKVKMIDRLEQLQECIDPANLQPEHGGTLEF